MIKFFIDIHKNNKYKFIYTVGYLTLQRYNISFHYLYILPTAPSRPAKQAYHTTIERNTYSSL